MKRSRTPSNFNTSWEVLYFFGENIFRDAECMICNKSMSVVTKYNVERHYSTYHKKDYISLEGDSRIAFVKDLREKFLSKIAESGETSNTSNATSSNVSKKASYIVAFELAKRKRPMEDGEFVKELLGKILSCYGESGAEMFDRIQDIPLSPRTMMRRIEVINEELYSLLKSEISNARYTSIALDESTDISDTSQLLICIRTIRDNFEIHEEMLSLVGLHGNTKGIDIFNAVKDKLNSIGALDKLCSVCTDGAPAMVGRKDGFVGQLMKNNIDVVALHCIIHQEALVAKSATMKKCMATTISIVNKIRGGHNALTHRKFIAFLEEYNTHYSDLLMYTEVRWLSRGKCLQRFFDLRKEILEFLKENSNICKNVIEEISAQEYLCNLAFLTDITCYLSELNLNLQGNNKNIHEMVSVVKGFKRKMEILLKSLKNNEFPHFKNCSVLREEFPNLDIKPFATFIEELISNFELRFQDFNKLNNVIFLFNNALYCEIDEQESQYQMELADLQNDLLIPLETGVKFWKEISADKYPVLKSSMLKLMCYFGSTYICESTFSMLKVVKSKSRNRLTDEHLESLLRIGLTTKNLDWDKIISNE